MERRDAPLTNNRKPLTFFIDFLTRGAYQKHALTFRRPHHRRQEQGRLKMRTITPFVINFALYISASEAIQRIAPHYTFLAGWIAGAIALAILSAFETER